MSSGCRVLEARQSEFIDWVRRGGEGISGRHDLVHTVILTSDDVIEIVAFESVRVAPLAA